MFWKPNASEMSSKLNGLPSRPFSQLACQTDCHRTPYIETNQVTNRFQANSDFASRRSGPPGNESHQVLLRALPGKTAWLFGFKKRLASASVQFLIFGVGSICVVPQSGPRDRQPRAIASFTAVFTTNAMSVKVLST